MTDGEFVIALCVLVTASAVIDLIEDKTKRIMNSIAWFFMTGYTIATYAGLL